VCPDTVTYDWASATLVDNTSSTTTTVLARTCSFTGAWVQSSGATLTGGHSYTLTLLNHDDNYPGDPTYTLFDDVAIAGNTPADFNISASPGSLTIAQGGSGTSIISTAQVGGPGTVNLSASVSPAGPIALLNPTSVEAGGSSTLTVNVGLSVAAGTYTVTVTGAEGANTHPLSVSVTVTAATANDFSIAANPSTLTVAQGNSGTSTISTAVTSGSPQTVNLAISGVPAGASASLNPASITAGGSSRLTVQAGTAAPGTYTLTVTGAGTSATHSTTVSLTVPPNDFSIAANPSTLTVPQGNSGTSTIGTAVIGNPQTVSLAVSGVPAGASATLNPGSITAGGSSTLTVQGGTAALGTYTLTVTGTGTSATHSTTLSVTVTASINDFSISANPSTLTLAQGNSGISTIGTAVKSGSPQTVNLAVSGVPAGASATLNPASITAGGSSTLTVQAGTAAPGTYTLTVTGTGTSATHSTTVTLTVPPNDFSIAASPSRISVKQGDTAIYLVTTGIVSGASEMVVFSVSGVPPAATARFTPPSVSSGGTTRLRVTPARTTPVGDHTLTITGTAPSGNHKVTVVLNVHD